MCDIISSGTGENIHYFNHAPGGCNVLFMDGHVSFVKYPGIPPVDKRTANLLGALLN